MITMMGIKEYETVRTVLLTEWSKIADQVPTALKSAVDAGIAAVTSALGKAQNEIISLLDNGDISDDYRRRKMDEVKQMVVETYTAEVEKMNEALQKEVERLQEILTVPKPKELDQGELLNLKTDLKMLLDTMDKSAARMRLGQELEKALETGDEVKAWLLGASDWPSLYMESRGFPPSEWEKTKEAALINRQDQKQAAARQLLKLLTDKQKSVVATIKSVRFYASVCVDKLP
jgi:DNA-binding ferritin-like protein